MDDGWNKAGDALAADIEKDHPITHYLAPDFKFGLCGAPDPIVDLNFCKGEITCADCLDLWEQGYNLTRPPQWWWDRLRDEAAA